jgi:lipid II:glycine glycyltransferase (peptidoglycan interpeptide bridge formation enzyme)
VEEDLEQPVASIRKADRAGVTVREGRSEDDLRTFYALYLRTMRRRCVLPRPFRQLQEDRRLLGPEGNFRLFLAEHEGDVVAGGIYHALGRAVDLLYNGSDDARLDVRPNHALYWHVIEWAAGEGYSELDFGHARADSSLARFKAQWSAREVPEYRYDYVPGADTAAEPAAGGRALEGRGGSGPMERVWPHLPLPATRVAAALAYRFL